MLSFKYIYRNLVRQGRPGDQILAEQPQLETLRQAPAGADLAPLTQVRRSLFTVYRSGRTGSKTIDHITRAVYKEWRYRSSEYPDLKAPLQAACSAIGSGIHSTDLVEMEAVNQLIEKVHALLISIGFLPLTSLHLIAVLIVIEASPQTATGPVLLPESFGARNPLFPKDKEMKAYAIQIVDEIYLSKRFMDANDDIRARMRHEWDLLRERDGASAGNIEQMLTSQKLDRAALRPVLESLLNGAELATFPPSLRPYMLALVLHSEPRAATVGENRVMMATGSTAGEAAPELALDANLAGYRPSRRNSGKSFVKQLARIRPIAAGPKVRVP